MTRPSTALAALATLATSGLPFIAACSPKPSGPPSPVGPHALWSADPASLANPFPDARLAGPDGGFGLRPDFWQPFVTPQDLAQGGEALTGYLQGLGAAAGSVEGFGNDGAQLVPFSAGVDAPSLAAAFAFVRLSVPPVVEPPPRVSWQGELQFAAVQPAAPLLPATPYALVLTAAATASGQPLARSADFDAWARGSGAQAVASLAAALGLSAQQVVFASLFTTEDVRSDLQALATWVAQPLTGAPSLTVAPSPVTTCTPGASASTEQCPEGVFTADAGMARLLGAWFDSEGWEDPPADVGTVIAGDVALQDVRDGEDGHFVPGYVASPDGARTVERQFVLATPDPQKHPMPAAGWPMVIAAHGLGGGNSVHLAADGTPLPTFCLAMAEFLAQNGYGCLGIDAPSHQSRGSFVSYFDMQDLAVTRDYLREMIFDQMQLGRLLASWPAGLYGLTVDPARIAYVGQSLGSIEGATLFTLDPRTRGGVLLVPGGGLTEIVQSPTLGGEVGLLLAGYTGLNY